MIVLRGLSALSSFRLERLNQRLQSVAPKARLSSANWIYFVQASEGANPDLDKLGQILQVNQNAASTNESEFIWVVPRLGTISPWSSKATEILRACDLPILRVERGMAMQIDGLQKLSPALRQSILALLHDAMTQSVLLSLESANAMFAAGNPASLSKIALGNDPLAALSRANIELGLALSEDEIDYLKSCYLQLQRDPSDAELMMFAQANSEHCRHKVFNASWTINGQAQTHSLFSMIKNTHAVTPAHTLTAYSDNAAVIEGNLGSRFQADAHSGKFVTVNEQLAYTIKVETHNHPTGISPFAGASTGAGGEIRDEGATGRGGKPKAGLTGFSVSHLRIPGLSRCWEQPRELSRKMASSFEIMLEGPIGAAAFNNEFGRPALLGYFRSFELPTADPALLRGYDKPIMLAGGLGVVRQQHVEKILLAPGDAVIVLGGPAMLIGLGGGAASSLASGESSESLDFASVQRDNPEMERRCQEVIDACMALGENNPIRFIHDVGAGGLSNAIPELLNDSKVGGRIELRKIPCADPSMSPMQIWSNESQERYVMGVGPSHLAAFEEICRRERCPFAVVGEATAERHLLVSDALLGNPVVDIPMDVVFGKAPKMHRDAQTARLPVPNDLNLSDVTLQEIFPQLLRHPTVGSKSFLITIGDRSVGGLVARDQMVGPWQVPVADCAVTLSDFSSYNGEAMSIGERTPLAIHDAPASARMAVAEALTNLAAAPIADLSEVKLSANWMAAVSHSGEDAALFDAVRAVGMQLCPELGVSIPVGKDSLSMQAVYTDTSAAERRVVSPVSLIISAFARCGDVRRALTPQLKTDAGDSLLLLIDLGAGRNRLGGSILAQTQQVFGGAVPDLNSAAHLKGLFNAVQTLNQQQLVLAYHDRSDGGALVALFEMALAARCGITVNVEVATDDVLAALLSEELGALLQIRANDYGRVKSILATFGIAELTQTIAVPNETKKIEVRRGNQSLASWSLSELAQAWHETSHAMQARRDNPNCADSEAKHVADVESAGLQPLLNFDPTEDIAAPMINTGARPKVAVLREQGVNGQIEMAAAFTRAGFDAYDVHMSDLISGRYRLNQFEGFAACGGFSYGDVLGAGRGWATSIRFHAALADQFAQALANPKQFALGVCNGCQMMSGLKDMIPGAEHWPSFERNASEQYEARLAQVEILASPSIFLQGMQGSRLPVVVAHGEGRAVFADAADQSTVDTCLRFVDADGNPSEQYPVNPNGSPAGITGVTNKDGRVTILMPHPERVFRTAQMSWAPAQWGEDSPWLRLFRNARVWVGS